MKSLWIIVLSMWINLNTSESFAQEELGDYTSCGLYEVSGVVRKEGSSFVVKVKEGSTSEVTLALDKDLGEVASIYLDKPVLVTGKILGPVAKSSGYIESTKSVKEIAELRTKDRPYSDRFVRNDFKERVPDPLHPEMDSGFTLDKKLSCKKSK